VTTCSNSPTIDIAFTDGVDLYQASFDRFTSPPRTYLGSESLSFSLAGSSIQKGRTRPARKTWAIATYGTREDAFTLDEMYQAWDRKRSRGLASTISISDQTFVRDKNQPITANVVFTSAPEFEQRSGNLYLISFGMTEV